MASMKLRMSKREKDTVQNFRIVRHEHDERSLDYDDGKNHRT